MTQQVILVDRSRDDLSKECEREYYWTYHAYGRGLSPLGKANYFVTGEAIHVGIQSSMLSKSWNNTKDAILQVFELHGLEDREQIDLAIALVYTWRLQRLEAFLQEYRPLTLDGKPLCEAEVVVPIFEDERYKVLLMSRPDIIVERLQDKAVLVWELKSTSTANKGWIKKYEHNLQLLLQAHATNFLLQSAGDSRTVVGVVVEGFVKGTRKEDKQGIKTVANPLIYGYVKRGDGFIIKDQWSPKWTKGWTKELVSKSWQLESWIESLPEEVRQDQLRVVPPMLASTDAVESVCRQVAARAVRFYEAAQQVEVSAAGIVTLDKLFNQNFNNCFAYGEEHACPMLDVCFQHTIGEDPLGSGLYQLREPNHQIEKETYGLE